MASLQKKITYEGDLSNPPVKTIYLEFEIPVYKYSVTTTGDGDNIASKVEREIVTTRLMPMTQVLNLAHYQIDLGEDFVIGEDRELFQKYLSQTLTATERSLGNFFIDVDVHYFADEHCKIRQERVEAIYFPDMDLDASSGEVKNSDNPFKKILLVNKAEFFGLVDLLKRAPTPLNVNEISLLAIISLLTDLKEEQPTLLAQVPKELERIVDADAFEAIKERFDSLFDFPLTIPEIKTTKLGGTFTLKTSDNSVISQNDFLRYKLSAEYSVNGESHILRYTFPEALEIQNNSAPFSFSENQPIIQNCVSSILVTVKGIDGSTVWSKVFQPDYEGLNSIPIEVTLQKPNVLTRLEKVPFQDKRLRGQVLELSNKCLLKDLTVLVQAKKDGDEIWRILGAATTDSSGNFSMPYPFGIYTEAQAITSLTPNHPAGIPIIDVRDGNQTISDDFLYLLVQDVDCPHIENGEDCDCHAPKKASRLPGYADLIESDEYTQDIGGACVNLSTPNRTLSEFNYQAIVRTSDPAVANYTLKKIAVAVVDVSIVLNALTASNAASNALLNNLNYLNTTLNGALTWGQMPLSGVSNAFANTSLAELTAALNLLNAALSPLNTASKAGLGTTQNHLNAALNASDAFNVALGGALSFLSVAEIAAITAANSALSGASIAALHAALAGSNVALTAAINAANLALNPALNASSAVGAVDVATRYELVGGAEKIVRKSIDLDNPVAWQDAPDYKDDKKNLSNLSFYQAVTIATGHILHYKSLFKADGYSLGDLIYSLPLAPGQKKQIVTFDASHTLQGAESQVLTQGERLAAGLVNERDITNQLGGNITEAMRGRSSANTSGISAGFGTGGSGSGGTGAYGGSGSAVLGVAGGAANADSNASSNSSRDVSQSFGETLRQSIMQNAESYRQLNASVVTTVQEGQRYGVISEVVANHNHCHALTMMYFEVLRHYAIFQELSGVEECVFVPLLMTNFSTQNIYKWRDVLAQFLLPMPSETYLQPFSFIAGSGRQHPLLKAFDANERIKTQYAHVDFPQGSYDDEPIRFIKGEMRLRVELPRPKTRYDRIMSLPITTKGIDPAEMAAAGVDTATNMALYATKTALTAGFLTLFQQPPTTSGIKKTVQDEVLEREKIFDSFMSLDANYQSVPPAQCIRVTNFSPPATISGPFGPIPFIGGKVEDFFAENENDKDQWKAYAAILGFPDVLTMLNAYFRGNLISEWDDIFYNQMAPVIFEKIVSSIEINPITPDFSSETKYKGGERLIRLNLNGTISKKRNELLGPLKMNVSNTKIQSLQPYVTLTVEDITILYSTSHYNGMLFSGSVKDELLDGTTLPIPMNSEEQRNPKKEDAYLVYKLIEHLNSNLEHYNKVLWYNLDPDRRYMLLDGFNIQIFNDFGLPFDKYGNPLPSRSLASVVKNDLITVTGNSLVFPVAAGYKVSQDYILEKTEIREETNDEKKKKKVTLLDHYKPLTPIQPYRISIPSKGVFAEAVQGACNACEKIETERLQDWKRFPNTDEPTPISPVTPPTVAITDWKAAFKDFTTPMINIQNAPANPMPGAGLAGLSELLGQSGVFKDITGLEGNQQNVMRTYLSNQENAKAFGQMAKEMAMQGHNTQNTNKIMDSLKEAKDSGALNQEEYSKLVKDHLQQQIDGGVTKQAELEKEKQANPSLIKAAIDAVNQGKDVKAQKTDNEGNSESVDIEPVANSHSTGRGGGQGGILGTVADLVMGSVPGASRSPLVSFDPHSPSSQAQAAWAKMVTTSPTEHQERLDDYIDRFGFDKTKRNPVTKELEPIRGKGIREPAQGILPDDIEAVLAVATVLGTAPEHVLSVWISEGKLVYDRMLRGFTDRQGVDSKLLAVVDDAHKRAFARSLVFFKAFGSDAFMAMIPRGGPDEDNLPLGVDANHDAAFNSKLVVMRAAGVGGMSGKTDREIRDYFTLVGGGLRVMDHPDSLEFGLRNDSVASWLWLQAGLFEVYRRDTEKQLKDLLDIHGFRYGSAVDLSDRPWVTYLRWNGGPAVEGLSVLAEASVLVDRTGEGFYEAELYRIKGELLLAQARKLRD